MKGMELISLCAKFLRLVYLNIFVLQLFTVFSPLCNTYTQTVYRDIMKGTEFSFLTIVVPVLSLLIEEARNGSPRCRKAAFQVCV